MSEEDGGLPEETAGKLDQENAVEVNPRSPWKNSLGQDCFQNVDDLYDLGKEVFLRKGESSLVIVIDNEGEDVLYPKNKNYWVIRYVDMGEWDTRNNTIDIMPLVDHYSALRHDFGSRWAREYDQFTRQPEGGIRIDRYEGLPVYVPDPARDDNRPETQSEATTSATTGNTTVTTTTSKPGAAGVVTESETVPGKPSSRFDSKGATPATSSTTSGNPSSRFDSKGATPLSGVDANDPRGRNQQNVPTSGASSSTRSSAVSGASGKIEAGPPPPCLPQNMGSGSGSTPPSTELYPDAILRQARAAAANSTSVDPDANDPRGPNQRNVPAPTTAPTTVTQSSATSNTPTEQQSSVYIYEPITPGFDRYDFNTGKKVYTPNNGPSRTSSGQTVIPDQGPTTTSSAAIDGGIAVGTTTGGPSLLRQRREAAALSGGAG